MGYYTFADAVQHARNWLGASALGEQDLADCRQAAIDGLRELAEAHTWTCYYTVGRLNLRAPYSAGTIAFDMTGGVAENLVTLSGGTWPSWAGAANLRIGEVLYPVSRRLSDTTLTLKAEDAPGADLAAGTGYQLIQDTYLLPADWRQGDTGRHEQHFEGIHYVHPGAYLRWARSWDDVGTPHAYTITQDVRYPGRLVARLFPPPQEARTVDFLYRRSPRVLRYQAVRSGTITVAGNGLTCTATSAAFKSGVIGSVIRIGETSDVPTPTYGLNPYAHESRVSAVASTTVLTMEEVSEVIGSRLGYEISDPVDVLGASMLTAYKRAVEWQMSLLRSMTDKPNPLAAWYRALEEAKAADTPSFGQRAVGVPGDGSERFYGNLHYGDIDFNQGST
jgi:hypothetical protein